MDFEFMTADTVLPPCMPLPPRHVAAAGQQHRKGHVCPPAGRHPYGGYGGYQRDTVCPFPHCGAGGGLVPKLRNRQAFLERIGGRRTDPAGASGRGRTEPHLHAAPQEGGLP